MKIPFIDQTLATKILELPPLQEIKIHSTEAYDAIVKTKSRASTIVENFIGRTIAVHNGKTSQHLVITEEMVGHKLGEFVFTKKIGKSIHNSEHNRKKKEKLRRKITQKKIRRTTPGKKSKIKKAKKKR